ncbi:MAG: uracil-DNA glycosylase [Alphaproteobacteria bacterium]
MAPSSRPRGPKRRGDGAGTAELERIARDVVACTRCPRLLAHCSEVARVRVRRHRDEVYWGRPVPSFGDPGARLLVLGLAPAAHGANRTGRMFTGDSSGDWLYRALHRAGFANRARSVSRDDGLVLRHAWIAAAAHCAPPDNKPLPAEMENCRPFLEREIAALPRLRAILALGKIAWDTALRVQRDRGAEPLARVAFAHEASLEWSDGLRMVGSYHPSRQNTQTGRLDEAMLDRAVALSRRACGLPAVRRSG